MKKIKSRWQSKCAETGATIRKGEDMYYDYGTKKCYSVNSERGKFEHANAGTIWAADGDHVQANEDAYFDNFCQQNNI